MGAESLSTLLDESSLLRHCQTTSPVPGEPRDRVVPMSEAVQSFRYFVIDNSTIAAVLEEPLGNDQEPQPTVSEQALSVGVDLLTDYKNLLRTIYT